MDVHPPPPPKKKHSPPHQLTELTWVCAETPEKDDFPLGKLAFLHFQVSWWEGKLLPTKPGQSMGHLLGPYGGP